MPIIQELNNGWFSTFFGRIAHL